MEGGVVGVSVLVDLDIAIKEGTIFFKPSKPPKQIRWKGNEGIQNDASYIPANIHPLLNDFSHEGDYLDQNPKNTYQFDS